LISAEVASSECRRLKIDRSHQLSGSISSSLFDDFVAAKGGATVRLTAARNVRFHAAAGLNCAGALIAPQAITTKCDTNRASSGQAFSL
jgi:hypothetical protein